MSPYPALSIVLDTADSEPTIGEVQNFLDAARNHGADSNDLVVVRTKNLTVCLDA